MTRKRLSHNQYVDLVDYMRTVAIEGKILMKPGDLAAKFNHDNDFEVNSKQVSAAAKKIGIELIFNQKRDKPSEDANQDNVAELVHRLASIESKVDALLKAWDVKCGRLV